MSNAILHIPTSAQMYEAALEGLTREDELLIAAGEVPASVYDAGAVYRKERQDVWRHAKDVADEGWGDCEDLAAYRAAELRVSGEDPDAKVITYQTGPRRYHAVVQRGSGVIDDPSIALGMKVPEGVQVPKMGNVDDAPGCVMGEDPTPGNQTISFDLYRHAKGWSGVLRVPLTNGQAAFLHTSPSAVPVAAPAAEQQKAKADATAKAQNIAAAVLKDPAVQALLPPQAVMALKVVSSPQAKAAVKVAAKGVKALKSLF